jgi:toxin ParE1/3/4
VKRRTVILSPEARGDLLALYDYIADAASPVIAARYLERVETYVRGFEHTSERGTLRDDVRPGLRIVGFERRITIAFTVSESNVTILRLFNGGQDWGRVLQDEN